MTGKRLWIFQLTTHSTGTTTMSLRVNTNIFSMTAQKNLANHSNQLQSSFARLSSGLRIVSAADDPAGLGISERMRSEIRSLQMAQRNAQDGVSLVQTAEGALSEVNSNLVRMRELAIESANGTLNTSDRTSLNAEFTELVAEIDRIALTTAFNGINLLDGLSPPIDIQTGADSGQVITVALGGTTDGDLGIDVLSVIDATNASAALGAIDLAVNTVVSFRGQLGASQNRMSSAMRSIATSVENLAAAESRIRDVDVAAETATLTRNQILQQASASILAQANQQPQIALSLLQG
jgi:flagellin